MILVTGGTGLLGEELIRRLLAAGKTVRAIYHNTTFGFTHERLEQVKCDVLDVVGLEDAMENVDELYHCAGMVSFVPGKAALIFKVNVEGTANVVNAALNTGVKKMVHVSSIAALGNMNENVPVTEAMQWTETKGNSKYGQSKYLGELEVWRGIAEGLNAVIVNPSIILGPGNPDHGSTGIFRTVYKGFPWYSEGVTGFVDVRDVAELMILLMASEITAERFIINGANECYRDIFYKIADAFGKPRPQKKVTAFQAALVWRLEAAKSKILGTTPLVTKETAANAMRKLLYDNSKLLERIPSFTYRPIETTIADTCAALQQKLNKL